MTPRLPERMEEVAFRLIPFALPINRPPKEIVLNREVRFEQGNVSRQNEF